LGRQTGEGFRGIARKNQLQRLNRNNNTIGTEKNKILFALGDENSLDILRKNRFYRYTGLRKRGKP